MEWTREKTIALINEYRMRRGLWDMTHDDYRKKEVKHKLLVEVGATLGENIPIAEIEKKFHTLRTQYHRELSRIKRKEPYNSKWFGFKKLQFLSSPKACRSAKGRIKPEITEEGTLTTQYIIKEIHDSNDESPNSTNNDDSITITRKLAIEPVSLSASRRAHELEKLIEETTKDVEDIEEPKPSKLTIKKISLPLEHHHNYNSTHLQANTDGEISVVTSNDNHHHHEHHYQEQQSMEEHHDPLQTMQIQETEEDEMSNRTGHTNASGIAATSTTHIQHHHPQQGFSTRIIKVAKHDNSHVEESYYDDGMSQPHIQVVPASSSKKYYYDSNGQQHTPSNITSTPQPMANSTIITTMPKIHIAHQLQQQSRVNNGSGNNSGGSISTTKQLQSEKTTPNGSTIMQQSVARDEFGTYGEYVANEMREIKNREVLIALKHKINTALFEANMADLQK